MNIKDGKTLAIMLGLATITALALSATYAAADQSQTSNQTTNSGSTSIYPYHMPPSIQGSINLKQIIFSSIKVKFSEASDTAASAVDNGIVLGGRLTVMQGYLIYHFQVVDGNNMVYSVIVDPGTGQILYKSDGSQMSFGEFGGLPYQPMMYNKFHPGMPLPTQPPVPMPPMPQQPSTQTPSGTQ